MAKKKTSTKKVTKKEVKKVNKEIKNNSKSHTKKSTKKVVHSKEKPQTKSIKKDNWKTYSIISGIICLILFIFLIINLININSEEKLPFDTLNDFGVIVIEDPLCSECNVDLFLSGIRGEIEPNMNYSKIDYNSDLGKKIIEITNSKTLPIVIFTKKFEDNNLWESINSVFRNITINENPYYILSQQNAQLKKVIEFPQVNDNTIVFGNLDSNNVIYEFCSFESPNCALVNGNELYLTQIQEEVPTYQTLMPQVLEDSKIYVINNPQESYYDIHVAAFCANEFGKYREFRDEIYDNQIEWSLVNQREVLLLNYALKIGLNEDKFSSCITQNTQKYIDQIEFEKEIANTYQIFDNPTYIINDFLLYGPIDYISYTKLK